MLLEYFPETDTLYIHLRDSPGTETVEVAQDVVVDLDSESRAVGIEVEHISAHTDMHALQRLLDT